MLSSEIDMMPYMPLSLECPPTMLQILEILLFLVPGRHHHHHGWGYSSNYDCRSASEIDTEFRIFGYILGWFILAAVIVLALYAFVPNFHIPLVEKYLPVSVGN